MDERSYDPSRTSAGNRTKEGTRADHDVVVVGGGPSGCSAGVFTARYGLDTVVFDRGASSLARCAYMENYPGFPAGIGVDTLYELLHAHATEAGCVVIQDLVESITRTADGTAFVVATQDGRRVTASRIVAATRYGGEYLRELGDDSMFVRREFEGEERDEFDDAYAEPDGRTPIDGLYVAAPAGEHNSQAIRSAGHGSRVARSLLADYRMERGYPESVATHWDWLRRDAERDDEWRDRDRWRTWYEERIPDETGTSRERLTELRERDIDRRLEAYLERDEVEARESMLTWRGRAEHETQTTLKSADG